MDLLIACFISFVAGFFFAGWRRKRKMEAMFSQFGDVVEKMAEVNRRLYELNNLRRKVEKVEKYPRSKLLFYGGDKCLKD